MSDLELGSLVQRLTAAVQKLDPKILEQILSNKASLDIVVKPLPKQAHLHADKSTSAFNCALIETKLDECIDRNQAHQTLQGLKKTELEAVAKYISISIDSSANKEKIITKIVERKVGLRLRQKAFSEVMSTT